MFNPSTPVQPNQAWLPDYSHGVLPSFTFSPANPTVFFDSSSLHYRSYLLGATIVNPPRPPSKCGPNEHEFNRTPGDQLVGLSAAAGLGIAFALEGAGVSLGIALGLGGIGFIVAGVALYCYLEPRGFFDVPGDCYPNQSGRQIEFW